MCYFVVVGENAEKEDYYYFFLKGNIEVFVPDTKFYGPLFQTIVSVISVSFVCIKITRLSPFLLPQLFS